jgi:hypothetical protein
MNEYWLVSYIILWLVVIGCGLILLAIAREVESMHGKLETLDQFIRRETYKDKES